MPSTRSSRRAAAITNRQRRNPRLSTREIGAKDAGAFPLSPELAEASRLDRAEVEARRAAIRKVLQQLEDQKRQARREGDQARLQQLKTFSRSFAAAARTPGSLDRYSR
jgi:hypothetical protein